MITNIGFKVIGIIFKQVVVDITFMVIIVHKTIFGCIAANKILIGCKNPADYKSLANYTSLVI